MNKRTGLKIFFATISLTMIYVTLRTCLQVNLFHVLPAMVRDPWTMATFIDFYFNILIFTSWVIYKERRLPIAGLWFLAFIALGSIATSAYVLTQLFKLKSGDSLDKILAKN